MELCFYIGLPSRDEVSITMGLYPYSFRLIWNLLFALLARAGKVWVDIVICCLNLFRISLLDFYGGLCGLISFSFFIYCYTRSAKFLRELSLFKDGCFFDFSASFRLALLQ